jgi:hypothetical protein
MRLPTLVLCARPYHCAFPLNWFRVMDGLWIFVLEGAVVLALAIFIIWWTWPKKKK